MTYVAYHARGTKAQCRKGRVRHSLTIDEDMFQRIRERAIANKQSISAEIADRLLSGRDRSRAGISEMNRAVMPPRRYAETFNLRFWNRDFTVTVGLYADGKPGEVFISGAKSGMDVEGTVWDAAVLLSLALQHDVPLSTIQHAVARTSSGKPAAIIGAIVDRLIIQQGDGADLGETTDA